ncbi:hypothetical protein Ddye_021417 [Dipteronia dyeriana]|uniref:DUF659 domain-containing protein n=1 Tax=Dipteronia dyeriana TaxID=168575 RepID=A0AAD9U1P9_9ROSI|nr:hypothetical protein Ddye_021417 [Dipteronia dyeriana]
MKRKSDDIGWEYANLIDPSNFDEVKCNLCSKEFSGGVYRLKQHIARITGNVFKCPKSMREDQVRSALTDRKRRSIMNLCVNNRECTTFLSSKESSDEAHTEGHIFEYVFKYIEQVGPQNIVQVVTDNASNNMLVTKMLKKKMPNIFWSSCVTHTINLMHEVDDDDEEVEPGMGFTWKLVDEAIREDEMTQPRRSARVRRGLEEDFQSKDELVEEDNFKFESDEEQESERYGDEQNELGTYRLKTRHIVPYLFTNYYFIKLFVYYSTT